MSPDELAVLDMLEEARNAVSFIEGLDEDGFRGDLKTRRAVERSLEIIGEASKRVGQEYRSQHAEIPWRHTAGLRDVISHEYHRVDLSIVWDVVHGQLPALIESLTVIAPEEE